MSISTQRIFAVAAPALYYVMLSSMALTFQLWGGPREAGLYSIVGYLAGLTTSGLTLPILQRRFAARSGFGPVRPVSLFCLLTLVFSRYGALLPGQ